MVPPILRFCVMMLIAAIATACARSTEVIRTITYPSSFQYLSDQEIRTVMGRLAKGVVELDAIVEEPEPTRSERNGELVEILRSMRSTALLISKGPDTNHPRIDRYLPSLIEDLDRAIFATENGANNSYYYVGSVTGACEYCHQPRHEPLRRKAVPPAAANGS